MRVVDGMHRLRAAVLRRHETIKVRFFDGPEADAFVFAVRANATHGLPLSLADRKAAASRLVRTHPQWSDRAIAAATGLAPNTIGALRRRASAQIAQPPSRVGRDGRVRPVDSAAGRELAGELLRSNPTASLREVARSAMISPNTVRDVRDRLRRGEGVVPRQRSSGAAARPEVAVAPYLGSASKRLAAEARTRMLRDLRKDPSLRFSENGRVLLRLLDALIVDAGQWARIAASVPEHCADLVQGLAAECAVTWQDFARTLETAAPVGA
jgi:hypothetical protein